MLSKKRVFDANQTEPTTPCLPKKKKYLMPVRLISLLHVVPQKRYLMPIRMIKLLHVVQKQKEGVWCKSEWANYSITPWCPKLILDANQTEQITPCCPKKRKRYFDARRTNQTNPSSKNQKRELWCQSDRLTGTACYILFDKNIGQQ